MHDSVSIFPSELMKTAEPALISSITSYPKESKTVLSEAIM